MFFGVWFKDMGKAIEGSFFRKLIFVFLCVTLPGGVYGLLLFLGNYNPQFQICSEVRWEILLKDEERTPFAGIGNLGVKFDECARESGREFCLGLLGQQVLRGLTRQPSAIPSSDNRASDGYDSANDFIRHFRLLLMVAGGILVSLSGIWVGWTMRDAT